MRASLILAVCLTVGASYAGILAPGKYNGVVIFDRWDACHLYTGAYQLEISEEIKEQLRPYRGKAILIDAQDVRQPMNPGDAIVTRLQVLGGAQDTTPPHITPPARVDGLSLRVVPSFAEAGPNELVLELRNLSGERRRVDTRSLGPTLLTRQRGRLCFTPADGASFPVVTRTSVASLQGSEAPNMCDTLPSPIDVQLTLAPGFAVAETRELEPGEALEIPLRIAVSEGEYEFLAGYGSSYEGPALASNLVGFDADHSGQLHLIGDAASLNRPKRLHPRERCAER